MKKMKLYKKINLFLASLVLILVACEPNVDQEHLKNTTDVAGVELVATQSTAGGNEITLQMTTPGITGYWDYVLGKGLTNKKTIVFPVTGTFDFKFVGSLGAEIFEKPITVNIENLDTPVPPEWRALLGDDAAGDGKTWVFNGTPGNGAFWYMSPKDGTPDQWNSIWWNAGDCCVADPYGKMKFDLAGGANYTYYSDATATGQEGSFELDIPNQTISFIGAPILGGQDETRLPKDGIYHIISLTESELIIWTPLTVAGDSGWTWVFKPQ